MIINCFIFQFSKVSENHWKIKEKKTKNRDFDIIFVFFAFLFVPLHPKKSNYGKKQETITAP